MIDPDNPIIGAIPALPRHNIQNQADESRATINVKHDDWRSMEKLGWDGNVQRISSPLTTKVQRVEIAGEERVSFFQAVADSYKPALEFKSGNTVFTDGDYLYGYVIALDEEGHGILNHVSQTLVSYFTQVRIPPLVLDRREGDPYTRYIPAPLIEDSSHPLFPNHAGILPAWPR